MTSEQLDRLEELWKQGVSVKNIARELGYSVPYVNAVIGGDRNRFPYRYPSYEAKESWRATYARRRNGGKA